VLAELRFGMSDLVDPTKARQLGKMVGVQALVVGTVSDLGNQVDLDARLIDVESARLLLGATVTISKDPTVKDLLLRGCQAPVVAAAPGAPASPQPAPAAGGARPEFTHKLFRFELLGVERMGREVRLTLLYTNRQGAVATGILRDASHSTYLVDNLGNRCPYVTHSFGPERDFPPGVPERMAIVVGEVDPEASTATATFRWQVFEQPGAGRNAGWHFENVVLRDIPLPR
jgi:hypothetical protein